MHEQFAKLATKLITNNGRAMQLVEVTNSGEEWNPTQSVALHNVVGVQTKLNFGETVNQGGNHDGVTANDKIILLDASIKPKDSMKLRDGSLDFEIVNIDEIKPADTAVMYRLRVRS